MADETTEPDPYDEIQTLQNEYDDQGERHMIIGLKDGRSAQFWIRDEPDGRQSYVAGDGKVIVVVPRVVTEDLEQQVLGLLAKAVQAQPEA